MKLDEDYDFDAHKQLVPIQPADVPTTNAPQAQKPTQCDSKHIANY